MDQHRHDVQTPGDEAHAEGSGPPTAGAPPTVRGEFRPMDRAAWPTVIGVISIVLGSMGVLGNLVGLVSVAVMQVTGEMFMGPAEGMGMTGPMLIAQGVYSFVALGVSVLLLTSGIGVVQRRLWGVKATRLWAWTRILLTVVGAALTYWVQTEQFAAMDESMQQQQGGGGGAPPPGLLGAMGSIVIVASVAWALVWGWAWPVICLIWLARAPVKAHYLKWHGAQAAPAA